MPHQVWQHLTAANPTADLSFRVAFCSTDVHAVTWLCSFISIIIAHCCTCLEKDALQDEGNAVTHALLLAACSISGTFKSALGGCNDVP